MDVRRRFGDIMGTAAAAEIAHMVELVVESLGVRLGRPKYSSLSTPDRAEDFDELNLTP